MVMDEQDEDHVQKMPPDERAREEPTVARQHVRATVAYVTFLLVLFLGFLALLWFVTRHLS